MTPTERDRFTKKVKALDYDALGLLVRDLVGRTEMARVRFNKSRSVRDGDAYARRRGELGIARTQFRILYPDGKPA